MVKAKQWEPKLLWCKPRWHYETPVARGSALKVGHRTIPGGLKIFLLHSQTIIKSLPCIYFKGPFRQLRCLTRISRICKFKKSKRIISNKTFLLIFTPVFNAGSQPGQWLRSHWTTNQEEFDAGTSVDCQSSVQQELRLQDKDLIQSLLEAKGNLPLASLRCISRPKFLGQG